MRLDNKLKIAAFDTAMKSLLKNKINIRIERPGISWNQVRLFSTAI